jgi:23S rRNA pseudouridine1911/1915/1917 synthase
MPRLNSGYEYRSTTGPDDVGLTIVEYLALRFPHSSAAEWHRRVAAGLVRIGELRADPSATLDSSQTVVWSRPAWQEPDAPCSFALLHRDPHLLVVAKPRGLPVLPGGGYMQNTLMALVRAHFPGANPLHRLGRGTSGLVLFSRTPEAARRLSEEWCGEDVSKVYLALVTGAPAEDAFRVEIPIGRIPHRLLGTVHAASTAGKPARSDIRVLERRPGGTLVEVRIFTGRTHQVRIHLAAAGHPLVGDDFYTSGGAPAELGQSLPGDTGFHLHAWTLEFTHPFSGNRISVACSPPPILRPLPSS